MLVSVNELQFCLQIFEVISKMFTNSLQIVYKQIVYKFKVMVTFNPCIRGLRSDGCAKVYIRVTKDRVVDYMATDYIALEKDVQGKKVTNQYILMQCLILVNGYVERINKVNSKNWSTKEVIAFLERADEEISFSEFYQGYMNDMIKAGRETPAESYKYALQSFITFCKGYKLNPLTRDYLNFSDVTSQRLNAWIESLGKTKSAKNKYPTLVQAVFNAGLVTYNDYDNNDIRIKNMPFMRVVIPKTDKAKKKATDKETLLKLFNADVTGEARARVQVAQDVALMIFCLAGINVADLYHMEKSSRVGNKLCYNRHKTKDKRDDDAYIEITIPDKIIPLFDKYKGEKRLLSFSDKIRRENDFIGGVVVKGLQAVALKAGVTEKITSYTFRHSFATIAQNKCGASDELVGFALNHASAHKVTQSYIDKDFSPIDKLNKKVMEYVFGGKKPTTKKPKT